MRDMRQCGWRTLGVVAASLSLYACPFLGDGEQKCYSPTNNLDSADDAEAIGCECDPARDRPTCVGGVGLYCAESRWQSVEDGSCPPDPRPQGCNALDQSSFVSVLQHETGLCADGQACRGRWGVSFADGRYDYYHSDMVEAGSYECNGNTVVGGHSWDRSYEGTYDSAAGELTWDGVLYVLVDNTLTALEDVGPAGGCTDILVYAASPADDLALFVRIDDDLLAAAKGAGEAVERSYSLPVDTVQVRLETGDNLTDTTCDDVGTGIRVDGSLVAVSGGVTVRVEPGTGLFGKATVVLNSVLLRSESSEAPSQLITRIVFQDILVGGEIG